MIDINEMTVLIVDDMPNMITTIRSVLRVLGFGKKFLSANNGEEAWRVLQKEQVDVAIVDYNMPVMTGVSLLGRIREDRDLRDLPIVMVTAEANRDFVAEAAESEIDAYVLKPVTVKVLGDKVSSVVENANNPPPMVYHLQNARRFEDSGDLNAAIDEAKRAMDANPNSTRPMRELGYYYFKMDDLDEAEKWLLKAAELNPLDVIAFHHLGELYLKRDQIEEASHYFDKAVSISPRHVSRTIRFGKILVERGMFEKAAGVFDKAIDLTPNDTALHEEMADLCLERGAKEYGAKVLETIVRDNPKRKDLLFRLGVTFEEIHEYDKALGYLTQAEKEDEENVEVKLHISRIYLTLGMPIRAEKGLKAILFNNPKNKEARELLRECI